MDKQLVVSVKTVLITALIALGVYVLYMLGPVLAIGLISVLIVISVESFVKLLMRQKLLNRPLPRVVAVTITYILLVIVVVFIITTVVPPVVTEGQKLIVNLPKMIAQLPLPENFAANSLVPQAFSVSNKAFSITLDLFSNVLTVVSIFILALYMSYDWEKIKEALIGAFPVSIKHLVKETLDELEQVVGVWVKGQAFLMLVVGVFSFIGLSLLNIQYPMALGILAGILEAVPIIGPVLTAVVASVIAFADSPLKGVAVIVLFIIIQQTENNLLVPKVMEKASGYSSIVILLVLMISTQFFGITGAVLALPTFMGLMIVIKKVLAYVKSSERL